MRIKQDYVLRQVADNWVVLPVGEALTNFHGMLTLNESGAALWKALEVGGDAESLADVLQAEYSVDRAQALADAEEFMAHLKRVGCAE